jgi:large subunit ribosomal protein L23
VKDIYSIIKRPLFTEKGAVLKEKDNKVVVEVDLRANKTEIKRAVEELFKVKVQRVHTITMKPKLKRWGRSVGYSPKRKKAIITLKKGEKLDFIEGM